MPGPLFSVKSYYRTGAGKVALYAEYVGSFLYQSRRQHQAANQAFPAFSLT
jgi:hypothetical protein